MVVAVPSPVVLQVHALVGGYVGSPDVRPDRLRRRRLVRDLVDVVAQVQDEVQVVTSRRIRLYALKKPAAYFAHDTIAMRRWSASGGGSVRVRATGERSPGASNP